jgi:hypothetical protein
MSRFAATCKKRSARYAESAESLDFWRLDALEVEVGAKWTEQQRHGSTEEISRDKGNEVKEIRRERRNLACQREWNQGDGRPPAGGCEWAMSKKRKEMTREI